MEKLKLTAPIDDKPVKLTIELPAQVHRDLVAYADVLSRETAQSIQPGKLKRADARRSDGVQWRIPKCAETVAMALADAQSPATESHDCSSLI